MHQSIHAACNYHGLLGLALLGAFTLTCLAPVIATAQCENYESYLHWTQGVEVDGDPVDMVVRGNYAYVLVTLENTNGALQIIDISDPGSAQIVGTYSPFASSPYDCDVQGNIAFVISGHRAYTLDVSDPAAPTLLAVRGDFPGGIEPTLDLVIGGDLVFVALGGTSDVIKVLDISDPNTIAYVTDYHHNQEGHDLEITGNILWAVTDESYLRVYDVSDPLDITPIGGFGSEFYQLSDIEIEGDLAVLAAGPDGAWIYDVSGPTPLVQLGIFEAGGCADFVDIQGEYCYVSCAEEGVTYLVDIGDPANPVQAGVITQVGTAGGIDVSGSHMYMIMEGYGVDVIAIADPAGLDPLGFLDTTGNAEDVFVSGNFAYVADGDEGLKVIDISDVYNPVLAGSLATDGYAEQLSVAGQIAFVAVRDAGLQSIDISSPSVPLAIQTLDTPGIAVSLTVADSIAYLADSEAGLQLINVADPAGMFIQSGLNTEGSAEGVSVAEGIAYVADRLNGLVACNVEDPSNPWIIGGTKGLALTDALAVDAVGSLAYVAGTDSLLFVVDMADTLAPAVLGQIAVPDVVQDVSIVGDFAYIASAASGMQVVDVSDDVAPFIVGGVTLPSTSRGVHVSGDFAYVAADSAGLQICPTQCGTYQLVVAAFTPETTEAFHPVPIQFFNQSIGYALTFNWDFGDGVGTSQEPSPIYLFDQPGDFTVTLSVQGLANTDVISHDVKILSEAPWAPAVTDVPDDQGGYVYFSFHRSGYDDTPLGKDVELYTIQRKDAGTWIAVATTGAYGEETYTVLVPTLGDGETSETEFRVIGHMSEGNWASPAVLGYSEDNIPPQVPANLGWLGAELLGWDPVPDNDLAYYGIYGGQTDDIAEAELLGATTETQLPVPVGEYSWYFVVAVDDAGLPSEPGTLAAVSATPSGVPVLQLFEAVPNPFNPATRLSYTLPEGTLVRLAVYDLSGRLVRLLVNEMQPAGRHGVVWDGRDETGRAVSSGPYFYQLQSGGQAMTRRMMLLK